MMKKILIAEDNNFKKQKILQHLQAVHNDLVVDETYSFTTTWKTIVKNQYDLIILDMSLPTFDITGLENGGDFRTLGGKELAKKMKRRNIETPFVIVTHYKNFSDNINTYTFESLRSELLTEYPNTCLEFIYFSSNSSEWRNQLDKVIID
jgi:CheY-like chemotaxis protein